MLVKPDPNTPIPKPAVDRTSGTSPIPGEDVQPQSVGLLIPASMTCVGLQGSWATSPCLQ
jgi:hypothetical protein